MRVIRLGIIGLGRFAQLHMACLRQLPDVHVTAVCDLQTDRVDAVSAEFSCRGYTDFRDMLQEEQLDALHVLTPEADHYEPVIAGLEAGCHVFVEKPLAADVAEAERMIERAKVLERLLIVGHITRFDPKVIRLKQAIEEGRIGRLRSIYARRSDRREFFDIYKRVSPVYILGVHDIDQMIWYKNDLPEEVYAKSSSSAAGEDLVTAMMTFRDGTIATLDANWLTPKGWPAAQDQVMQVVGEKGMLRIQHPDHGFSISTEDTHLLPDLFTIRNAYGHVDGALLAQLRHVMDCFRSSEASNILRAEDALNVIRVADAIERSYHLNQPVSIQVAVP